MGIGAAVCTHGAVIPNAVADFAQSERSVSSLLVAVIRIQRFSSQKEMDYIIARSIRYNHTLLETLNLVYFSYDVICSWSVNWPERVKASPESLGKWFPEGLVVMRGIGQWHIHGHKRDCLVRYGFPFMRGAGGLEGEIVETLWAFINLISVAARAMGTGHRAEALNDGFNNWNWTKLLGAGNFFPLL